MGSMFSFIEIASYSVARFYENKSCPELDFQVQSSNSSARRVRRYPSRENCVPTPDVPPMFCSGDHRSFGIPSDKADKETAKDGKRQPVTVDFLDAHAAQKWEVNKILVLLIFRIACLMSWVRKVILHYLVSSGAQQDSKPSQGVLFLLERGGLMTQSRY
jgi:hypothetical protein